MTRLRLLGDTRGSVITEMAFAAPVLIMLMMAIMQISLVLQASGAMRNAMGQAIRYAKVHPLEDPDDAFESAALKQDVEQVAFEAMVGVDRNGIADVEFTRGTDGNGFDYATISVTYVIQPFIPFAPMPPVTLKQERTGYLPT